MTDADRALLRKAIAALQGPLMALRGVEAQLRRISMPSPAPMGRLVSYASGASATEDGNGANPLRKYGLKLEVVSDPPERQGSKRRIHTQASKARDAKTVSDWLALLNMNANAAAAAMDIKSSQVYAVLSANEGMSAGLEARFQELLRLKGIA